MSQPTAYSKATNFAQDEANNVGGRSSVRASRVDAELSNIETTLDQTLANLALIQRDDGKIRDGAVELFSLSATARAALKGELTPRGDWASPITYAVNDLVQVGGLDYLCIIAHTSGTFATDLAAGKWLQTSGGSASAAAAAVANLKAWGIVQAFQVVSATRNADGAVTSASIVWPDGVTGTYTADTLSAVFPGATDAWHATYSGSVAKTVTQPAVTRDANGAVIAQPALTIV